MRVRYSRSKFTPTVELSQPTCSQTRTDGLQATFFCTRAQRLEGSRMVVPRGKLITRRGLCSGLPICNVCWVHGNVSTFHSVPPLEASLVWTGRCQSSQRRQVRYVMPATLSSTHESCWIMRSISGHGATATVRWSTPSRHYATRYVVDECPRAKQALLPDQQKQSSELI